MTQYAQILVAAGRGARFGGDLPKQYRLLNGEPVIRHTLRAFAESAVNFSQSIIVVAEGDDYIHSMLDGFSPMPRLVIGGASRSESVRNGIRALKETPPDYVFIHDAARPFVSHSLMARIAQALKTSDAVVPALPVADALKAFAEDHIGPDIDRAGVRRVQTPQAFRYEAVLPLYEALPPHHNYSDDAAVALEGGLSVTTVEGEERNFKMTYPDDISRAETMMSVPTYTATGSGFDVHRFEPGDSLWLCGVEIPAGLSLKGHSDADVGLHALTDALLGAIAFGDIGDHFPPSDPQWAGAASDKFLIFARDAITERGGRIDHADVTLICEKPKIKPHREAMRARIAELLNLPLTRVSVKATTTEKLGFTGRGEGIAAQASATVRLPDA